MATIPLFLLEEHHEAFLAWNYAVMKQWIPAEGGTLLHVDEHADLHFPVLDIPPQKAVARFEDLVEFTYSQLSIACFIVPALYLGLFSRVYWLRRKHDEDSESEVRCITSQNGDGTRLRNSAVLHLGEALRADRRCYRLTPVSAAGAMEAAAGALVLDIDLDYFSCDNRLGEDWEIEITQAAYEAFRQDRFHPLKLSAGNLVKVREHKGSYYLCSNSAALAKPGLESDQDTIRHHIDAFLGFLRRNSIRPALIDVARSRISGYTPSAQWQPIEAMLLDGLASLYEFDVITPAGLQAPA